MHRVNSSPLRYPDAGFENPESTRATRRATPGQAAAYQHEVTLGVQHAGAYGLVLVVEGDDVKSDGLRHGQDDRQDPNGGDLHHGQQRDAHPLNPAPGRHGSVPGTQKHSVMATESAPATPPKPVKQSVSEADQNVKELTSRDDQLFILNIQYLYFCNASKQTGPLLAGGGGLSVGGLCFPRNQHLLTCLFH